MWGGKEDGWEKRECLQKSRQPFEVSSSTEIVSNHSWWGIWRGGGDGREKGREDRVCRHQARTDLPKWKKNQKIKKIGNKREREKNKSNNAGTKREREGKTPPS
jgi:hypothetical protein